MERSMPSGPVGSRLAATIGARAIAGVYAGIALGIFAGYVFVVVPGARERAFSELGRELALRAETRAAIVESWVEERRGEARFLADSCAATTDETTWRRLLESAVAKQRVRSATLLDASGDRIASAGTTNLPVFPVASSPAWLPAPDGSFLVRVVAELASPRGGQVVLDLDPHERIYPRLTPAPTLMPSSEALLATRDGNQVLFVSPLRFAPAGRGVVSRRLDERLAAAVAVTGKTGFGEYRDYRGEQVLAATRPVAGVPWGVVVKVDRAEVLAPLRKRAWIGGLQLLATIGLASAALGAFGALQRVRAQRRFEGILRAFFEGSPIGVVVGNAQGGLREVNDEFLRIVDRTRAEHAAEGLRWDEITPPEWLAEDARAVEQARRFGRSEPYEKQYTRPDGSRIWVLLGLVALPSEPEEIAAFVLDVDRRKTVERELRLQGHVLESATEHIVLLDREGRYVYANRAALEAMGAGDEGLAGRTIADFPPGMTATIFEAHWNRAFGSGEFLYEFDGLEGCRLEAWVSAIEFAGEPRLLILGRDVTDRARAAEALRRSEAMAILGGIVGTVAHEARNPMFAITATVDALETLPPTDPGRSELAASLRGEVDRLNRLMEDLLAYGRPDTTRRERVELGELAREAVRSLAPRAAERGVRVALRAAAPLRVVGDPSRLRQVIDNLLDNAIRFSPEGGEVDVGIEAVAGRVELVVRDRGPGVIAEDRARVFEPFFSRRPGGTGLGLAIARRVAEVHGGTLVADNHPDGGARLTLALPAA